MFKLHLDVTLHHTGKWQMGFTRLRSARSAKIIGTKTSCQKNLNYYSINCLRCFEQWL